jgi:hypothetical protein
MVHGWLVSGRLNATDCTRLNSATGRAADAPRRTGVRIGHDARARSRHVSVPVCSRWMAGGRQRLAQNVKHRGNEASFSRERQGMCHRCPLAL